MSDQARERIQALGNQLSPGNNNNNNTSSENALPPIQKVAGKSAGPRVEGKVIIITGVLTHLLRVLFIPVIPSIHSVGGTLT